MCTSLKIVAEDGSPVIGRTMEFPVLMDASLSVVPRGLTLQSRAADASPGLSWTTTHGLVGINALPDLEGEGPIAFTDALNEKGMYGGLLYHPGFCDFGSTQGTPAQRQLAATHFVGYILSTCATVGEARAAVEHIKVVDWKGFPVPLMLHFRFDDAAGDGIVVEFINGQMNVLDNPIGVLTNAPTFDWHLTNLRNYINLEASDPEPVSVKGVELAPLGAGFGMRGLPGDSTPPARFVRSVALVSTAKPSNSGVEAENMMLHLINNFDLPDGFSVVGANPPQEDQTLWSTISNSRTVSFSVRMQGDHTFRKIQLADVDFTGSAVTTHPLPQPESFPVWSL